MSQTIMQSEFDKFLLAVYSSPPVRGSDQYNQLLDAWMGGASVAMTHMEAGMTVRPELRAYLAVALARCM